MALTGAEKHRLYRERHLIHGTKERLQLVVSLDAKAQLERIARMTVTPSPGPPRTSPSRPSGRSSMSSRGASTRPIFDGHLMPKEIIPQSCAPKPRQPGPGKSPGRYGAARLRG